MSEPTHTGELIEMRKKIEALHCSTCESVDFCRHCIYQACREAFDLMSRHMRTVNRYYDTEKLRDYK